MAQRGHSVRCAPQDPQGNLPFCSSAQQSTQKNQCQRDPLHPPDNEHPLLPESRCGAAEASGCGAWGDYLCRPPLLRWPASMFPMISPPAIPHFPLCRSQPSDSQVAAPVRPAAWSSGASQLDHPAEGQTTHHVGIKSCWTTAGLQQWMRASGTTSMGLGLLMPPTTEETPLGARSDWFQCHSSPIISRKGCWGGSTTELR